MTDTEKILDLLEINSDIPSTVIDEGGLIISSNEKWNEKVGKSDFGKSLFKLFDKSTGFLIKNSFLDAKTFDKIQRRSIKIETEESIIEKKLLISPFRLYSTVYFFVFLYNELPVNEILIYPTLDKDDLDKTFSDIFKALKSSLPSTLIDKKNLQIMLDSEEEPISIRVRNKFVFTNNYFNNFYDVERLKINKVSIDDIFDSNLAEIVKLSEGEVEHTKSIFIIEKTNYSEDADLKEGKLVLYPVQDDDDNIFSTILFGKLKSSHKKKSHDETIYEKPEVGINAQSLHNAEFAQIIYDKNNFDILDVNKGAEELYGYDSDAFKKMNMTQLFPPEEMQNLLNFSEEKIDHRTNQLLSDRNLIQASINLESIEWEEKDAFLATITLNKLEEKTVPIEDYSAQKSSIDVAKIKKETKHELKSDFFSSLFHELLTPVNVILGFVQEIIDSVEDPTEEQEESAKIIKDNQQILLQAMNTAVQYTQLLEGKIKLAIEKFNINNYLVDLKDSFSQISTKTDVEVIFYETSDSIIVKQDRSKLLTAISFFVKLAIKITESSKIYISLRAIHDKLYVHIKDNENGISEKLLSGLIGIFQSINHENRNDYGISPIAIKLTNELFRLLSIHTVEQNDSNGIRTISIVAPLNFNDIALHDDKELIKRQIDTAVSLSTEADDKLERVEDDIPSFLHSDEEMKKDIAEIKNGEIDNKIIEDIEEEEEIVTEEIATVEQESTTSKDLSNYSCLFIDDNLDTQLLFKSQMKDFKFLKICSNLTEALPFLRKYNFDLILVDVNLNDSYNGFDALKIIRQFENYSSTPIIAVTAYSFEGDKQKFINFGFTDYFVKPLLREQLLKSLEDILQ